MTTGVMENLALLSEAPGGIEQLRRLIVELAVSGRLVPPVPMDEPGATLAARLVAAKVQATADGSRRQKALDRTATPVWPFAIPEAWAWRSLDDLLMITGGVTLGRKLSARAVVSLPYLRVANVQRGFLTLDDLKTIEVPADEVDKYALQPGDLLITEGGDWDKVGRTAIWHGAGTQCLHQNHVFRARACSDEFLSRWAELYLNSPPARSYFAGSSKQTTNLASINMSQLRSCAFPLPPLAEQHRIVAKVDELMALCDRLEARQEDAQAAHAQLVQALLDSLTQARDADEFETGWQRLAGEFQGLFATEVSVNALALVVLQLAIRGRLVRQDDSDEPADALLARISALKAAKQLNLRAAPANANDVPHALPRKWVWTTLADVAIINPRNKANDDSGASFVPMAAIGTGFVDEHAQERRSWGDIKTGFTHFAEGDIGLAKITPCFENSKACVFTRLMNGLGAGTTELHIIRPLGDTLAPRYVLAYLKSPWFLDVGESKMTGTAGQKRLPKDFVECHPFPLPPLAEQHRIVAKVTELLTLCDQLKARIAAARAKHAQLADALVAQAVAA